MADNYHLLQTIQLTFYTFPKKGLQRKCKKLLAQKEIVSCGLHNRGTYYQVEFMTEKDSKPIIDLIVKEFEV